MQHFTVTAFEVIGELLPADLDVICAYSLLDAADKVASVDSITAILVYHRKYRASSGLCE